MSPRPPPSSSRVGTALRLSVVDGALHAIMLGLSESYLGALAVELGHGPRHLALLVTVPLLAGALAQTWTVPLAWALGGRKRLVVVAAVLQALTQLAFLAVALGRITDLTPLLAAKTLFAVTGVVGLPAWNAWMATLTRGGIRERYFAVRSGVVQLFLFAGFSLAGVSLHRAGEGAALLDGFAALFVVAFAARAASALALARQHDPGAPSPLASGAPLLPVGERFRLALRTGEWRVALYVAALMMGAQVAIPFFTPFMLRALGLSYGTYAALVGLSMIVKAAAFPLAHRAVRRLGLRAVLAASGGCVAALPAIWATFQSPAGLVAVQVLSGLAWAGLEYASFQLLLSSARAECRIEFLSLAGALSAATQLAGALAAGAILEAGGASYEAVFYTSAILRAGALSLLVPFVWRAAPTTDAPRIWTRLLSVRASGGAVRAPIVTDAPPPDGGAGHPAGPRRRAR